MALASKMGDGLNWIKPYDFLKQPLLFRVVGLHLFAVLNNKNQSSGDGFGILPGFQTPVFNDADQVVNNGLGHCSFPRRDADFHQLKLAEELASSRELPRHLLSH